MFDWKDFFNDFADRYYSVPDFTNEKHVYALQNYLIEQGMLTEDVDFAIKTLLGEAPTDPKVRDQAKKLGLVSKGYGNWGKEKDGPTTHTNVDGELEPVGDKKDDDKEKKDDDKPINLSKGGKVDAQLGGDRGAGTMDMMDKDDVGKVKDKSYKSAEDKFNTEMSNMVSTIQFENEKEETTFKGILDKLENNNTSFDDEEKKIAKKYIAKSDSERVNKLYVARTGGETYDDKTKRGQVQFTDKQKQFMDDVVDKLDLDLAPAQAKKTKSGRVASKIRTKDLSPTDINTETTIEVAQVNSASGNIDGIKFGSTEHKIKSIPDKQKLIDAFVKKGMDGKKAELKAKKVRRALNKHNDYLTDLAKDRKDFKVAAMIDGVDPSTSDGRKKILDEYPKKLATIIKGITDKSDEGTTEEEQKIIDRISNLDSNLSTEGYEKESMEIMHDMLQSDTLASGGSDLAESIIGLIQTRKGHEVYFPSDVTYKVGDMICLGQLGDLDPNDADYYNKLADEASSIVVTVEAEGPGSVKVGAGAASAGAEKIRLTEYKNPNTRQILNGMIDVHGLLFKTDNPDLEKSDVSLDNAKNHASSLDINVDDIEDKAKEQANAWKEKWKKDKKKGSESWNDEEWDKMEQTAIRFVKAHLLIAEINNKDMDYQKFTNFRVANKKAGAELDRTDGVDCLGTMKAAPNMGFRLSEGGIMKPENVFSSRIGNSCKENK